ncbi:TPA: GGDEF domain-containing protein [Vibrio vulnificus]|uniref:GGDEF domain-containing protein n=1 Tax=Vibrio vulnificus TaxID=672 RepID=A0A8H9N166_VIBVL|nr:GGDEF domain-containing protein [Vibrio vulnificus]
MIRKFFPSIPSTPFTTHGSDLIHKLQCAVAVLDSFDVIQQFNPAFERMFGEVAIESSMFFSDLIELDNNDGTAFVRNTDGELNKVFLQKQALAGDSCFVLLYSIEQYVEREQALIMAAKTDKLTGLLNRKGFDERLAEALPLAGEGDDSQLGLLFIDLDEFKPINDTYGHDAGDALLIAVAKRLDASSPDYATIARLGGDEFVCLIPALSNSDELASVANAILDEVARVVEFDNHNLVVKCSIGGTLYPSKATSKEELFKQSDEAMYLAKKAGRNQVFIHN